MSEDRRIGELTRENAELKRNLATRDGEIEKLRAEVASLRASAAPPKLSGENAFVLRMPLNHNGVMHPVGAELPFDPANPPKGCDGLREGVHFERARVLRTVAPARTAAA